MLKDMKSKDKRKLIEKLGWMYLSFVLAIGIITAVFLTVDGPLIEIVLGVFEIFVLNKAFGNKKNKTIKQK